MGIIPDAGSGTRPRGDAEPGRKGKGPITIPKAALQPFPFRGREHAKRDSAHPATSRPRAYALLLGARNGAANGRRFSTVDDARLREITREFFPSGFSVLRASGGWWDGAAGKFIREESRQILVSATDEHRVRRWARRLGRALNQKSLFVIRQGEALVIKV